MKVSEFIEKVMDDKWYSHSCQYGDDRRILKFILWDSEVVSYGINHYNGIAIIKDVRKGGKEYFRAYKCCAEDAPCPSPRSLLRWCEISDLMQAKKIINSKTWGIDHLYDETQSYTSRGSIREGWENIFETKIGYLEYHSLMKEETEIYKATNKKIKDISMVELPALQETISKIPGITYYQSWTPSTEITIYRLKSGKLRVELGRSRVDLNKFYKSYTSKIAEIDARFLESARALNASDDCKFVWSSTNTRYLAYMITQRISKELLEEIAKDVVVEILAPQRNG